MSAKNLSEAKLKAFNLGLSAVKKLSKKEQAEQKKKEDEEATAEVFKEFVDTFSDAKGAANKTWVKGSTFQVGAKREGDKKLGGAGDDGGKLYKPKAYLPVFRKDEEQDVKPELKPEKRVLKPTKKKDDSKKKSNLELFKEELQAMQEERQQRRELKQKLRDTKEETPREHEEEDGWDAYGRGDDDSGNGAAGSLSQNALLGSASNSSLLGIRGGSHDTGDPMTTNLYLGNLNPVMNEEHLCDVFGKFGPLASVKVMWPRTEEERSRGRNCGFVAFMNRRDAERALGNLEGTDVMSFDMRMGWGKAVPIPPQPVYIPPSMQERMMPPPPTGLPFNAQPPRPRALMDGKVPPIQQSWSKEDLEKLEKYGKLEKFLATCTVKVVIPTDRNLLCLIHRMVEFVVREGPMFEAMIMNREISNPMFRFLFENFSPAHVYYRWRLFSVLQGDAPNQWRPDEFSMFKGGAKWLPPPKDVFRQGMSDDLFEKQEEPKKGGSGGPSSSASSAAAKEADSRDKMRTATRSSLEDIIKSLVPDRVKVGDAMVFCLESAEYADEIVECLVESLSMPSTPIPKKLARLYLVSDILYNSSARVRRASDYRKCFQPKLVGIVKDLKEAMDAIDSRLKAEQFKSKVMTCFRAWEDWALYPSELLILCQNTFLGLVKEEEEEEEEKDLDGMPLDDDVDGKPISVLDGKPLVAGYDDDDVDGVPMPGDHDGLPLDLEALKKKEEAEEAERQVKAKFQASKWETVDESTLESQAVTTSKWDIFESKGDSKDSVDEDVDGVPMKDDLPLPLVERVAENGSRSDSPLVAYGDTPGRDSQDSFTTAAFLKAEMTEEKRKILREVELKVMKFQDELESGKKSRKAGLSVADQVEEYRTKLLSKADEKSKRVADKTASGDRRRSRSSSRGRVASRSTSPRRASSRSPYRRRRTPDKSSRERGRSRSRDRKRSRSRSPRRSRSPGHRRASRSPPSKMYSSRSPNRRRTPSPRRRSPSPRRRSPSPRRGSSRSPSRRSSPKRASPKRSPSRRSSPKKSSPSRRSPRRSPSRRSRSPRSTASAVTGDTRRIIVNRTPSPDSKRRSRSRTPDYTSRPKRSPTPEYGSRDRRDSLTRRRGRSRSPAVSSSVSSTSRRRSRSRSKGRSSSSTRRSRSRSPAHKKKKESRKKR